VRLCVAKAEALENDHESYGKAAYAQRYAVGPSLEKGRKRAGIGQEKGNNLSDRY